MFEMYFPFQEFSQKIIEGLMRRIIPGGSIVFHDTIATREGLSFLNTESVKSEFSLRRENLPQSSRFYKALMISEKEISERLASYIPVKETYAEEKTLVFTKTKDPPLQWRKGKNIYTEVFSEDPETNEEIEEPESEGGNSVEKKRRITSQTPTIDISVETSEVLDSEGEVESILAKEKKRKNLQRPTEENTPEDLQEVIDLTLKGEGSNLLKKLRVSLRDNFPPNKDLQIYVRVGSQQLIRVKEVVFN